MVGTEFNQLEKEVLVLENLPKNKTFDAV